MAEATRSTLTGKAAQAKSDLESLRSDHDDWISDLEKAEDAYEGVYRKRAEGKAWQHQLKPRYAAHIIETTIASLIDPDLKFQVEPRPKFYEPEEWQAVRDGGQAWQRLLAWQLDNDDFVAKLRDLVLQERLGGISWAKVYWKRSTRMRKKLVKHDVFPMMVETEEPDIVYDGPCVDVCNSRDIVWDFGAQSIEKCQLIAHRIYVTYEEALAYQRAGAWRDVARLKDTKNGPASEDKDKRKDGRIEVWEIWKREDSGKIRVYTIGEGTVLLQERDNPYWHGRFPFAFFSSRKKPLMLAGYAQMDMLKDVQEQLWSVENLTYDALMLSIMPIIMYREDVEDPDALVFEPYSRWPVTDPNQVRMWTPEYSQAQVGMPHIQRLQATMQNISGAQPFTTTNEARTQGANTATEASLVASIAQQSMSNAKANLYQTIENIGQQFVDLNQQYIRDDVFITVLDLDEQPEIQQIIPEMLQGDVKFSIKPMTESLIRESRRAENTTKFQALMQAAPIYAATGNPLNMVAILKDFLEGFDAGPVEKYLSAQPQQMPPQQGSPPAPQGPGGVTNTALAAGPLAASNQMSQSAGSPMQQFMASAGGGTNV